MNHQTAFLIAIGITLAGSGLIVAALWRPLHGVLRDLCGTDARASFWGSYTSIMLMLVPLAAVLLGRSDGRSGDPTWVMVTDQARWAVLGLIVALFVVALAITTFIQTRTIAVRPDQIDDLQRLLDRVESERARQILRRVPEPAPQAGGGTAERA
jgi:hypothetical protein